jgi:hypothetical protein
MKALFFMVLVCAVLWTGFVVFANMMKPAETGGFVGLNTLVVAWLIVGAFGIAIGVG